ncbi:MAG: MBL fold metallo-hydrolase [Candidatus Bathyarchaeia archaeon]
MPQIQGIYKFDQTPPETNAVFLSHGHLDHSAYLSFIKREVPVYCGETTQTILRTLSEIKRVIWNSTLQTSTLTFSEQTKNQS